MSAETIDFAGETFALGCNVPEHFPTMLPSITTAPGFRVWSRNEIIDAIKAKPLARRKQFAGEQWIVNQRNLGCHDDKTEVLTEKGWIPWTEYDWTSLLGTMNPMTGNLEFQAPTDKHVYDYDGPMHYGSHRSLDFSVTPNHRMYVRKWNERARTLSNDYTFQQADSMGWYVGLPHATRGFTGLEIKKLAIPDGREFNGDDFIALVALVISDGWVGGTDNTKRYVSFCCFRDDRRPFVEELANRIGFHELPGRRGVWTLSDITLAEWFRNHSFTTNIYRSPHKKVPDIIKSVSRRQIELFLKFFGDHSYAKGNASESFYSSSRRMIDDLQELLLRIGKRGSVYRRDPRDAKFSNGHTISAENCTNDFTLYVRKTDRLSFQPRNDMEIERYKGPVFCATVPNELLVTRRNDSVLISGNSCNAAASVGALRRVMAMTGRNEVPLLCWEFLYAQINGGRDQGSLLVDGMAALVEHGAPPLDTNKHPIGKHFKANQFDAADHEAAKAWRAEACFAIDDELELATFILAGGAANVAVHVGNNFTQLNSQGFAGASGGPGNHAVVVDDVTIIDGELAFDMPNSWGLNFGDDGRAYLSWSKHFRNTVGKHRFFSVAAASNPGGIGVVQ